MHPSPRRLITLSPHRHIALSLLLALGALLLSASAALADATISSGGPTPLLVDGLETQKLPTPVPGGSEVCVPSARHYSSEGERWTFLRWSNGATDECITVPASGVFKAVYKREVLLHVKSAASGLQQSRWTDYGVPAGVEVPETVAATGENDRSRYKFEQWSDGETLFARKNTIAPLKPTTLEAKWVKEYQIAIESPPQAEILGSGWYKDGGNLVLMAPDTVPGETRDERWKFTRWEGVGTPIPVIPSPDKPFTTMKVDNAYTIRAVYDKQFLVNARNPLGTVKREWMKDGQEVMLETPPVIDVVPERERLVFRRWEGMDGLVSPKVSGVVDRAVVINARYDRQVMVTLNSPNGGSGAGWQTEGTTATVAVPASSQQWFLLRSVFVGFPGYSSGEPSVQVLIREPMAVTALYRTEPDFVLILVLLLLPLGVAVIYLTPRWVPLLGQRARENRGLMALTRAMERLRWRPRTQLRRP